MSASVMIAGECAKNPAAETEPSRSHGGSVIEAFRKIFPEHARKVLAATLGLSLDGAKKKLEGDRELKLDEFVVLLHTPKGFAYLTAVMADSQVQWWRIVAPLMEVAEVQAMQNRARRKMRKAIQGAMERDAEITATRSRAEALLYQDEDFYSGQPVGVRSMAGVPDRAGNSTAKGRGR